MLWHHSESTSSIQQLVRQACSAHFQSVAQDHTAIKWQNWDSKFVPSSLLGFSPWSSKVSSMITTVTEYFWGCWECTSTTNRLADYENKKRPAFSGKSCRTKPPELWQNENMSAKETRSFSILRLCKSSLVRFHTKHISISRKQKNCFTVVLQGVCCREQEPGEGKEDIPKGECALFEKSCK